MAIEDLREEVDYLEEVDQVRVEKDIKKLEKLVEAIKAANVAEEGTIENSNDLADSLAIAFADAEMTLAYIYFHFSQLYLEEEPVKSKNYLSTAIDKMENVASKLKGATKMEANKIIVTSKKLLEKSKNATKEAATDMNKQLDKIGRWLREHLKNAE